MTYGHDIIAADAASTASAGEALAALLEPGDVLGLIGGLGAGKTCFVQGVARGLGFPVAQACPDRAAPPGSWWSAIPAESQCPRQAFGRARRLALP